MMFHLEKQNTSKIVSLFHRSSINSQNCTLRSRSFSLSSCTRLILSFKLFCLLKLLFWLIDFSVAIYSFKCLSSPITYLSIIRKLLTLEYKFYTFLSIIEKLKNEKIMRFKKKLMTLCTRTWRCQQYIQL